MCGTETTFPQGQQIANQLVARPPAAGAGRSLANATARKRSGLVVMIGTGRSKNIHSSMHGTSQDLGPPSSLDTQGRSTVPLETNLVKSFFMLLLDRLDTSSLTLGPGEQPKIFVGRNVAMTVDRVILDKELVHFIPFLSRLCRLWMPFNTKVRQYLSLCSRQLILHGSLN